MVIVNTKTVSDLDMYHFDRTPFNWVQDSLFESWRVGHCSCAGMDAMLLV